MSTGSAAARLAHLGADVPERIGRLVADAERRQQAEIEDAMATALRTVPRPLRGLARRVLGVS